MNISCSGINFSLPERGRATQQLCSPPRLRVVYAPVPTWAAAAAVAAAAAAAATGAHTPSRSSHAPCSPQLLFQTPPPFPGPHCLFIHSAGCALSHPHLEIPPSLPPPHPSNIQSRQWNRMKKASPPLHSSSAATRQIHNEYSVV